MNLGKTHKSCAIGLVCAMALMSSSCDQLSGNSNEWPKPVIGVGEQRCERFVGSEADSRLIEQAAEWHRGFISGFNRYSHPGTRFFKDDASNLFLSTLSYCRAHTDTTFSEAAANILEAVAWKKPLR